VGTGIQAAGQLTIEARTCVQNADKLLYLVTEPIAKRYLADLNPTAESLEGFYSEGKDRFITYMEMTDRILEEVRAAKDVCVAFYGHPGVFVLPSHEAIKRAREEGFYARMLPGVSAEDCLFADLGLDPAMPGCQSFEATSFLINKWKFDPRCSLILWQIGVIGMSTYNNFNYSPSNLDVLSEYLALYYDPDHLAVIYEASFYPIYDPIKEVTKISQLATAKISPISTLYVPPQKGTAPPDKEMIKRLGMDERAVHSYELKIYTGRSR
jgi:uncharacterized protein YabN with tetrapyrrole methylase and pyrophosphatase domain